MKNVSEVFPNKHIEPSIVQFGEGNFLRGFVDYMVDVANEKGEFAGGIALVKPIEYGNVDEFTAQDCVYTVILRGKQNGETIVQERVVTCVDRAVDPFADYAGYAGLAVLPSVRFIVSNTTEAGIVFAETDSMDNCLPKTFPGKLTKFLYDRYNAFGGQKDKGLIILPVELIENNGKKLLECVLKYIDLWKLPQGFKSWVMEDNIFCSTLVDRIITGFPRDEDLSHLGYKDNLIVTGEPFALWVIESDKPEIVAKELPLDKAGMPVVFTDDQRPYRERKVRLLNGAHTSTVLAAYLAGFDYVGDCMNDKLIRGFMEKVVYSEIAPTVKLPADEVKAFADSVFERFENPFIKHALLSIALNSVSKWKSRILPSLKDSLAATGKLPNCLTFSFAALVEFYCLGKRGNDVYSIQDDAAVLDFFSEYKNKSANELVKALAARSDFWGEDLNEIGGFTEKVCAFVEAIHRDGIKAVIESCV